ncbi:cation diffusion facilitator family transporter [Actinomyces ruminis]|uniref:Cation transporter n=1 Tax=Actinomyces ruminis TaxID=1937003 RepID=A0ABX4M8I0_9ACTO|nr:cation diffusion facilitator family transporter [Actinomyces ruminis]PHP51758.1 cation transporter [Actinomyces ruminis]
MTAPDWRTHAHDQAHTHAHGVGASRGRLAIVLCLTASVLVAEVVTALLTGSLALLADAGHMLTDVVGLVMALVAAHLSMRPATDRSTWGLRRAEILGAALQASLLGVVGIVVGVKAVITLATGAEVGAHGMLVMGLVGLAANVVGLLVLSGGHDQNLNMRAAFLEVANDALGSVGVIVAAIVVAATGWARADAVASLVIVALIAPRVVSLLRAALGVLMERTPEALDLAEVRRHLLAVNGVEEVHDLHAWTVASGLPVLTAHVVVADAWLAQGRTGEILDALQSCVAEHFPVRIEHATFQLEPAVHRTHEPTVCV